MKGQGLEMPGGRKLLIINPNTNPAVTDQVRNTALTCAGPETHVTVVNPQQGPFAIETGEHRAEAVPHVLNLMRAGAEAGYDGYILACFDDIGIAEARRIVSAPVISLAEAAIRAAAEHFGRFAVVTTVEAAVPTIEALAAAYGVADRCIVRATGIGVAEAAEQTEAAERSLAETVRLACANDQAEAIVLGSGAYSGRSTLLATTLGVPFLDGLEAAIRYCEA